MSDNPIEEARIGSVITDWGIVVPKSGRIHGWDASGVLVEYDDGTVDVLPWQPLSKTPRWEWFGTFQ